MELDFNVPECNNCTGLDSCIRSCNLHTGKVLLDFLNRVDVIETRIGEYSSTEQGGKQDLVIHGHQLFELGAPSWLLTKIGVALDASQKFKSSNGKSAIQILNRYCEYIGMGKEDILEVTNKLSKINKNKMILLPFKPHTLCKIDYITDDTKVKQKEAKIFYLKWTTDKNTFKFNCEIAFKIDGHPVIKKNIKEYIESFTLCQLEMQVKKDTYDANLIKVTDYGIFKPIVVTDEKSTLALDATYLYSINNGQTTIIGYWDSQNTLKTNMTTKSKAYKKLYDNIDFIRTHKKYMAPYLLFEPNIIEIKN